MRGSAGWTESELESWIRLLIDLYKIVASARCLPALKSLPSLGLSICFVRHYVAWKKQHLYLHELILVGTVPRKTQIY